MKKIALFILLVSFAFCQYSVTSRDTVEFDTTIGYYPMVIALDAETVAVTYGGGANTYGTVQTYEYNTVTRLFGASIDIFEYTSAVVQYSDICQMDASTLVVAYTDNTSSDGFVQSLSVDGNFDNIASVDIFEFADVEGQKPMLARLDATHFVVIADPIGLVTFSMDVGGDNITPIDTLEVVGTFGNDYYVEVISASKMVTLSRYQTNLYFKTYTLDGSFIMTEVGSATAYTSSNYASMALIDDTHAIVQTGSTFNNQAYIYTYSWTLGTMDDLTKVETGLNYFNSYIRQGNSMVEMTDKIVILTSSFGGSMGVELFEVDGSYQVTSILNEVTIDGDYSMSSAKIDDNTAVVAYHGVGTDGFMQIIDVAAPEGWAHTLGGVENPTKVGGVSEFTKVGGVE